MPASFPILVTVKPLDEESTVAPSSIIFPARVGKENSYPGLPLFGAVISTGVKVMRNSCWIDLVSLVTSTTEAVAVILMTLPSESTKRLYSRRFKARWQTKFSLSQIVYGVSVKSRSNSFPFELLMLVISISTSESFIES